jgi:hypothetical protein
MVSASDEACAFEMGPVERGAVELGAVAPGTPEIGGFEMGGVCGDRMTTPSAPAGQSRRT